MTAGVVVFAHGSRIESANESVRLAAAGLARAGRIPNVEAAFLELGQPDLEGAVARLASAGVQQIVIIPYFLTAGTHLDRDLPRLVREIEGRYPQLELRVTAPLEGHEGLVRILLDRAASALNPPDQYLTKPH